MHTSKQHAKRSKSDLEAENKWLYRTLWKLIQETSVIQQDHAGLKPGDVKRIRVRARGEGSGDNAR